MIRRNLVQDLLIGSALVVGATAGLLLTQAKAQQNPIPPAPVPLQWNYALWPNTPNGTTEATYPGYVKVTTLQAGSLVCTDGNNHLTTLLCGGGGGPGVSSFDMRTGAVSFMSSDLDLICSTNNQALERLTGSWGCANIVNSFNGRTGMVVLSSSDVTTALGYTPANPASVVTSFDTRVGAVIFGLADIPQAGASLNQALVWNGSAWTPGTVAPGTCTTTGTVTSVGCLGIPNNGQTANYTTVASDMSSLIVMNGSNLTLTVATNASVPEPIGSIFVASNINSTNLTVTSADTLEASIGGVLTTGPFSMPPGGAFTFSKIGTTTWLVNGAQAAPACTALPSQTVGGGGAASVTFTVPAGGQSLEITGSARSTQAGSSDEELLIEFNGDTTSGHYSSKWNSSGGVGTDGSFLEISGVPQASISATVVGQFKAVVDNYAGTSYQKSVTTLWGDNNGSDVAANGFGRWNVSPVAITSFTLVTKSGSNIAANSHFSARTCN